MESSEDDGVGEFGGGPRNFIEFIVGILVEDTELVGIDSIGWLHATTNNKIIAHRAANFLYKRTSFVLMISQKVTWIYGGFEGLNRESNLSLGEALFNSTVV